MNKVRTVGELKQMIKDIPDNYKLELCVDNGVDGKAADNSLSSNSPIRADIWEDEKLLYLAGSTYTSNK